MSMPYSSVHLDRKDRLRLVCRLSQQVEDEHHFCLIPLLVAPFEPVMPVFLSLLVQYQTFLIAVKQMHVVDSQLGTVFSLRSDMLTRWVCTNRSLSVGPQLVPRTFTIHTYSSSKRCNWQCYVESFLK